MLQAVDVGPRSVECYCRSAGDEAVARMREAADQLRGARILNINATPYGGGVAEMLRAEVPVLRDLGIDCDWQIITGDNPFFRVTKAMHNALQGADRPLSVLERETYLEQAARNAQLLDTDYDLIIVHDPQPLPLRELTDGGRARWIWRCHIDTSEPNPEVWEFIRPFLAGYDAAVFTMPQFVPPDTVVGRVEIIPPAIDPESPKNFALDDDISHRVLSWIGVDPNQPLVTQVSRFDPWKDPLGVIEAWRMVRDDIPGLQLALIGSMALDDPEGWEIYRLIQAEVGNDPDVSVATNLTGVGNIEVNAFQRVADVVIQKSIREGFGLVVAEAMWKGTPVVAGRAGGIPLQMDGDVGGFLIESTAECAERVSWLLRHADEAAEIGRQGQTRVREQFLLPRLITDGLTLAQDLIGSAAPAA